MKCMRDATSLWQILFFFLLKIIKYLPKLEREKHAPWTGLFELRPFVFEVPCLCPPTTTKERKNSPINN